MSKHVSFADFTRTKLMETERATAQSERDDIITQLRYRLRSYLPIKIPHTFIASLIQTTCSVLHSIALTILNETYKSWTSSLCNIHYSSDNYFV